MKKICLDLQPMLSQKTGISYYTENLVKNLYNGNKNNRGNDKCRQKEEIAAYFWRL